MAAKPKTRRRHARQAYSLLEILVAMFVIQTAVLGFFQTQQQSHQISLMRLTQSQASVALRNLAEQITLNQSAESHYAIAYGTPPPSAPACDTQACTAPELARYHLARWKCQFEAWTDHATCQKLPASITQATTIDDGHVRHQSTQTYIELRWQNRDHRQTLGHTVSYFE